MKKIAKIIICILFALMIHLQFLLTSNIQATESNSNVIDTISIDSDEVDLRSDYAIFINLNDDRILYSKNAMDRIYPASMTKIMTTLVAIENIDDLDQKCTITEQMLEGLSEANASVAGFKLNESVSMRDLLYGILLPSGADASRAIAFSVFNDENAFVSKMNDKAKELNMTETHFVNVSGLHDDNHYSSVYDISLLLKEALKNELFKEIFCAKTYQCENGLILTSTMYRQASNQQMNVDFITGAKTGFTNEASLCLASYSKHGDEDYIMVSAQTNSNSSYPYHIEDAIKLYQYIFNHYARMVIVNEGDIIQSLPVKYSSIANYEITADKDISVLVKDNNQDALKREFDGYDELIAPIFPMDKVGTYTVYENDYPIYAMDVYLNEKIDKNLFLYYLYNIDQMFIDFKYVIGIFLIACISLYAYKKYGHKK